MALCTLFQILPDLMFLKQCSEARCD